MTMIRPQPHFSRAIQPAPRSQTASATRVRATTIGAIGPLTRIAAASAQPEGSQISRREVGGPLARRPA